MPDDILSVPPDDWKAQDLPSWEEHLGKVVSVQEFDDLVAEYKKARETYEEASRLAKELNKPYKSLESRVITALQSTQKDKYHVKGIGTVSIKGARYQVQTPKTLEDKRLFFNWLANTQGTDVADNMMSINSHTLNSIYNKELKDDPTAKIPGIGDPTERTILAFTKG